MQKSENNPLISVIVPYHNEGALLLRALESIAEQELAEQCEVIVIDDASTIPPPVPTLSNLRLRLLRSETPLHAAGARQLGISHAQGEFICMLDADDMYASNRFPPHVEILRRRPDVVLVGGQWTVESTEPRLQPPEIVERFYPEMLEAGGVLPESARTNISQHYPFHTGSVTIRRSAIEKAGGFKTAYRWAAEWDLFVRVAQQGRLAYVAAPAIRYILRPGSITSTLSVKKFVSGAKMFRNWRREIAGLSRKQRAALLSAERQYWLLAAQTFIEAEGDGRKALACSGRSLLCGPSVWGLRSLLRSGLASLRKSRSHASATGAREAGQAAQA